MSEEIIIDIQTEDSVVIDSSDPDNIGVFVTTSNLVSSISL